MKILVTGSEGLIGRPLCRLFEQRGDEVEHYDMVFGRDVLEYGALLKYVGRCDAVIHLAAQSGVPQSKAQPFKAWTLNVVGTLNVLNACYYHQKPVVVASSNHVYGHGDAPVTEDAPMLQLDTYSATKQAIDVMARSYAHNYGLPVVVVRNTNCFGPEDPHEDHIVPGTILSLLRDEAPTIISKGGTVKSYLYVDDVAEAYIASLDWLTSHPGESNVFNVTGERTSVKELVDRLCSIAGTGQSPVVLGEPNDQADEWLDDSRFREATGWEPKHTLDEALEKTYRGFQARHTMAVAS